MPHRSSPVHPQSSGSIGLSGLQTALASCHASSSKRWCFWQAQTISHESKPDRLYRSEDQPASARKEVLEVVSAERCLSMHSANGDIALTIGLFIQNFAHDTVRADGTNWLRLSRSQNTVPSPLQSGRSAMRTVPDARAPAQTVSCSGAMAGSTSAKHSRRRPDLTAT